MLVVAQNPDYAPQNTNQIKDIKRVEHHCFSDSQGNSRLVTVANHWQVLSLGEISYTKFMGRSVFQRDVVCQPQQLCNMSNIPQPAAIVQAPSLLYAPSGTKALPSMSIVVHNAFPWIPDIASNVAGRSALADYIVRLVEVVQLVAAGVTDKVSQLNDTTPAPSDSHSGSQDCGVSLLQSRLISELLRNDLTSLIQGHLDDIQKVLDLSLLEKALFLVGKEGLLLNADSWQSLGEMNDLLAFASEQHDSSGQQKFNSESLKPGVSHTLGLQAESGHLSEQIKPLGHSNNYSDEQKGGERFSARDNGRNETGKASHPEAGNKPSVNNNGAIQMMPGQGVSVLNQSSNILASNLSVVIQPPPMDSGQKQLPPIILPNTPGTGSSSGRRRKSRKEIKEEEEKEREGASYLFDDDPADDDLLEDE